MLNLKLVYSAPGEFGGVRSFTGDDGTIRRMWTINYLSGKINGFFGDSDEERQAFEYLLTVPVGTPARASGSVDSTSNTGEELRLVSDSFLLPGMDGFNPPDDAELLAGCTFSGLLYCWRTETRKDGSFSAWFSGMGYNFHFKSVQEDVFKKLEVSTCYRLGGSLQTSLLYRNGSKIPYVGVSPILKTVKKFDVLKDK